MEDAASDDAEARLLRQCRDGDLSAFDELLRLHRNRIYMISLQIVRNPEDALDVVQETFIRAWKAIARFDSPQAFSGWLRRVAVNASIDATRRRNVRRVADQDPADQSLRPDAAARTVPASAPRPGESLERAELRARIDAAIDELSPDHRAVILLKEIEDMDYREIARTLGCSVGTVMSRLFYARRKLQTKLKDLRDEI